MDKAKPFDIPKREVWEAFKKVKANQGEAGVDGQTVGNFEVDLSNNLYKLWNRMSSGSCFPPPVRRVDIPKGDSETETRPSWSRFSIGTPTDTDPAGRRSMPFGQLVTDAGDTTGRSTST